MGVAALLLVLALAGLLGAAVLAAAASRSSPRPVEPALALVAGLVSLHVLLLLFDLAAIPWRRTPLAAGWLVATALASWLAWRRRGFPAEARKTSFGGRPGPGDVVALVALLAYAAAAWTRLITIPDFVYHWGIKAKRHLLAGGIDYAFLADPLRLTDHPDYPSLVPGLYAVVGVVRGAFHERAALLVSVAFFALAVVATRRTVRMARLPNAAAQGTVAVVALVLALFGIGYRMAGAADWPIVAALLVALPALLGGPARQAAAGAPTSGDEALRLGFAAALAAGSKIEGVPLALLLIACGLARWGPVWWRGAGDGRRAAGGDLLRLSVPSFLVVVPWALQNLRHGLFAAENSGPPALARVPQVATAAVEALSTAEWYGLPWLLLLLPLAVVARSTRLAAIVLLLQAGFYTWVYLTSPVDTRFLVLSSLPRLLFHLVPPLLVLLAVLADGSLSGRPGRR